MPSKIPSCKPIDLDHLTFPKVLIIKVKKKNLLINPLSPHDALKHHFTSLKTDLIFLKLRVLEGEFP